MGLLSRYRNCVCLVFIFSCLVFYNLPYANATGGAFTSTKHGGGTVDGIKFNGVDRSINPDFTGYYYNDPAGEAGQYQPGECAHCHEPHASFGGSEPLPVNNAADPYLLMEYGSSVTNYAELCWYCHDTILGAGGPGTGYWGFYQGSTNYQASSHYKNSNGGPAMAWPGAGGTTAGVGSTADVPQTWPRKPRATTGGNPGSCLNCHTPHGVSGNYDTDATGPQNLAGNYIVATTQTGLIPRQLIAREEALCLNCHDGAPASTDIKTEIDKWGYLATTAASSGHPTREPSYFGNHNLARPEPPVYTSAGGWFTTAKHAECVDCHNPHAAQGVGSNSGSFWNAPWDGGVFQWSKGGNNSSGQWNTNRNLLATTSTSVRLAAQNRGAWGVSVNATTGAVTGVIYPLQSWNDGVPNFVYQLCIKCHSAWAWGLTPGTPAPWSAPSSLATGNFASGTTPAMYTGASRQNRPMTDQAWEFATDGVPPSTAAWTSAGKGRTAYHPIFAQGRNRPEKYTQQFTTGTRNPCWCAGTSCPPTVASYATSLQGTYGAGTCSDYSGTGKGIGTRTDLTGADIATLSQNFVPPWMHTSTVGCTDCHEDSSETTPRGPHGSSRPYILRKLDSTISYARTSMADCVYATSATCASAGAPGTADTNNLCLNCHRADVYGWSGQTADTSPSEFARQPHKTFKGGEGLGAHPTPTNGAPNGIACMLCHGGNINKLGAIHGNDYTATACATNCTTAGRLIAAAGTDADSGEWKAWTKSAVETPGGCTKNITTTSPYCANGSGGSFDAGSNYNY